MITNIDIARLRPHANNPRMNLGDLSELSDSIKVRGVLQNLTVVPVDVDDYNKKIASKKAYKGDYTIIIGHRRHAAAKLAELDVLPCIVVIMDEKTQIATMLLENIQRNDLTYYEQAQGIQLILDMGETETGISELTGLSKQTIKKRVKLLSLNAEGVKQADERGATLNDYDELFKIKDESKRNEVLKHVGTSEFDMKKKQAIDNEKTEAARIKIIETLETFATKDINAARKYKYHSSIQIGPNSKCHVPGDAGDVKYYYDTTDGFSWIYLYTDSTNEKSKSTGKQQVKKTSEKTQKEKDEDERKANLDKLSEQVYELRSEFIKNINPKKEQITDIVSFLLKFLINDGYINEGTLEDIVGDCGEFTYDEVVAKTKFSPLHILLSIVYSIADECDNSFIAHDYKHDDDEQLNDIYDFLETLGYQMSTEEKQYRDGTHELFIKQ